MIKIAFLNQKGGVGKTTSTVNIAATMAKRFNKKVLVIDCDSQTNATQYLSTFCQNEPITIVDCVEKDILLDNAIEQIPMKSGRDIIFTNMWLLASDKRVSYLSFPSVYSLKRMLRTLEDKFDYCLFDLPPQFNGGSAIAMVSTDDNDIKTCNLALSAMIASDYVIVPTISARFSINGYDDLLESINAIRKKRWNPDICLLGTFFNNYSAQRSIEKYIMTETAEKMDILFKNSIKAATVIEQAEYFGIPIPYFDPKSVSSVEYIFLTQEIIKRIKKMGGEESNGKKRL